MFFSLSSDGANPRRMGPTTRAAPGRRARTSLPAGGAPHNERAPPRQGSRMMPREADICLVAPPAVAIGAFVSYKSSQY
ncbi:hypothetical protein BSFP_029810 [Burkholderia stabilis]|uniref:Uncharacterized protein n=1 Tax=Burkholderia stabilis TaxID=95485 RepID=A0A1Y1BP81_9BURK|nr:hypothetical protein BSFP_029810 [Burkholderia stabilis]